MQKSTLDSGVVIHLGAGRCSEFEQYLALHPRQLLLIEADPLLANALQTRAEGLSQVQIICAAVAGSPGSAILHRYNLPGASSLHAASGLKQLFPGLKEVGQVEVEAVRPETLLQPLNLEPFQEHTLVIDLPGEEFPVLQALQESQLLTLFSRLYLNCGGVPLYEGSLAAQEILSWLQREGFDLQGENRQRDPDRPCWALKRNPLRLENMDLQSRLQQLTQERDEVARARDEQAHWHQENAKWAKALDAENQQLKIQLSDLAKLVEAAEQKRQSAELSCQNTLQENEVLLIQLQEAQEHLDETTATLNKLGAEIGSLTNERDEVAKARDKEAHWHQENAKWAKTLEAEKQQLKDTLGQQVGSLTREVSELQRQIMQLTQERDEAIKGGNEQMLQLENQLPEMEIRQQILNEELIKAEGQIELIKDLLLREPGL